jgi:hypothetical protein
MAHATALPLRLRTRRRANLLLLLGCIAFVAGGVLVRDSNPAAAYAAIGFFGLGVAIALVNLLPGSSYLELDARGFTICQLFRKSFLRWQDIAEFFPFAIDGAKPIVAVRFAPSYRGLAAVRRFATQIAGAEGALPETYGLSAAELARLLNQVRAEQSSTL